MIRGTAGARYAPMTAGNEVASTKLTISARAVAPPHSERSTASRSRAWGVPLLRLAMKPVQNRANAVRGQPNPPIIRAIKGLVWPSHEWGESSLVAVKC